MCPWPAAMMSLGQYIVALGAMVNIITTSIGVGQKSILAWGCVTTFVPVLYSILSSVIHLVSAASYLMARKMAQQRSRAELFLAEAESSETRGISEQTISMPRQLSRRLWLSRLGDAFLSETTICANRPRSRHALEKTRLPRAAILIAVAAGG